jgi:23S rRNA (adenine2030-N6)-methyltransferase
MKYRHAFHAGNFADVHKHVTLLSLIEALQRKPRGFLYLDTHAGAGLYALQGAAARKTREAADGIGRLDAAAGAAFAPAAEIRHYLELIGQIHAAEADATLYPGSPVLVARRLRPQDRLVAIEFDAVDAAALADHLGSQPRLRIERGDGFAALKANLPPPERRGLVLLDPPYEETALDFARVAGALAEGLRRFATGVFCAWYPIKDRRTTDRWCAGLATRVGCELLCAELWRHPTDSAAGLNGSGLLVANPPWQVTERMREWLPQLAALLQVGPTGGSRVTLLNAGATAQQPIGRLEDGR